MIEFRGTMPSLRVLEINKEKMISHRRFSFEPLFSVSWLLEVICLITDAGLIGTRTHKMHLMAKKTNIDTLVLEEEMIRNRCNQNESPTLKSEVGKQIDNQVLIYREVNTVPTTIAL